MTYDAVIVGSGFGGAFTALRCVQAGLRTVLVERGGWPHRDERDWNPRDILIDKRYRSRSPLLVRQYGDRTGSSVFPNEVVGGNSVFYGGASLRLRESDFDHWPFSYGDLEPYYAEAEILLDVHGESGHDPCEPERSQPYPRSLPDLSAPAKRIQMAAKRLGMRPFPIPMAINFDNPARPLCIRCITCDGFPCRIEAKNDMAATLLRQAQQQGLEIVAGVAASHVIAVDDSVDELHGVAVTGDTRPVTIRGTMFFLAAGALHTPAILLRSALNFPGSEWLGRCLMRHCNAVVTGIFPFRTNPEEVFHKQLCFSEFYEQFRDYHGRATGIIQDIYSPAREVIAHFSPFGVKGIAGSLTRYMQNLLCIAEDEPRRENAVTLSNQRDEFDMQIPWVEHNYSPEDYVRRDFLVSQARRVLRAAGAWTTRKYEIDTFSHAVGTARCGNSPEEGAVDNSCRVWGVNNLHIVDGSCFPTSGGVNPSLTIAANALRVVDNALSNQ